MFRFNRFLVPAAGLVLSAALVGGCQSSPGSASTVSAEKTVIAGGTTFVSVPTGQGQPVVVAYTTPGKTVCPECEAVATKYFETGVLDESVCKTCGAHLSVGQAELIQPK